MSENLKKISESIDAVRISIGQPPRQVNAHLDTLLGQISDELRRITRVAGPNHFLTGLVKTIEGKL